MLTYLDNNATTRIDPRVLDAMLPYLTEMWGNPSSMHHFGAQVAAKIEEARSAVAKLIHARDTEIIFTSGGTEADNAAVWGVLNALPDKRHVVFSAVEHHAILDQVDELRRRGYEVDIVGVDTQGRLDLAAFADALRGDTALASLMLANNETGVIFPLREMCEIAAKRGIAVHTDAVNAVGKMAVDVEALGVSMLSLSGHKLYGPKGVGALYIRRGTPFRPLQIGGPQERGRRGGTLNAPGIIGLGAACDLFSIDAADVPRIRGLRDRLEREILAACSNARVVGLNADRLVNTSCICFEGIGAEAIVLLLSEAEICVSSGAACSSGSLEPSHVLKAMGIPPEVAQGQVRFSLGRFSTTADVDRAIQTVPGVIEKVGAVNIG